MLNNIIILSLLLSFNFANAQSQGVYSDAYIEILNSGWAAPVTYQSSNFPTTCSDEKAKKIFSSIGIPDPAKSPISTWIRQRKSKYNDLVASTVIVSKTGAKIEGAYTALKNFQEEEKNINRIMYNESTSNCNSDGKASGKGFVNPISTAVNSAIAIAKIESEKDKKDKGIVCPNGQTSNNGQCPLSNFKPQPKTAPPVAAKQTSEVGADGNTYTKIQHSDGTSTTVVTDKDGKNLSRIDTNAKGTKSKVFDTSTDPAGKEKIKGEAGEKYISEKEKIFKENEKKATEAAQKVDDTTKDMKSTNESDHIKGKEGEVAKSETAAEKAVSDIGSSLASIGEDIQINLDNGRRMIQTGQKNIELAQATAMVPTNYTLAALGQQQVTEGGTIVQSCTAANAEHVSATKELEKIGKEQRACNRGSSISGFLCKIASSPAVTVVATMMNASAAVIPSLSSAKDTCSWTSKTNLAGQTVLAAGTATCLIYKQRCENKCAAANVDLAKLQESVTTIGNTQCIPSVQEATEKIASHTAANKKSITDCEGHKVDVGQMTATAVNMMGAATQAAQCERQLSSENGTNNTANTLTVDQMCAKPEQAMTSLCKCRNDNTAVGCPGYIAGNKNEGNLNKDLTGKGAAGMAGLSYGKKITPSGGPSSDTDLDGLSDEAKKALAVNADTKTDPLFGVAAGSSGSSGSGGTSAGAGAAAGSEKVKEDPKSFGSSFMNAVGSLFGKGGGSSGSGKGAAKTDPLAADKYKEKIKRQIAAEQMRSEISSASGMDNWSKIKSRYKSNGPSLIDSN